MSYRDLLRRARQLAFWSDEPASSPEEGPAPEKRDPRADARAVMEASQSETARTARKIEQQQKSSLADVPSQSSGQRPAFYQQEFGGKTLDELLQMRDWKRDRIPEAFTVKEWRTAVRSEIQKWAKEATTPEDARRPSRLAADDRRLLQERKDTIGSDYEIVRRWEEVHAGRDPDTGQEVNLQREKKASGQERAKEDVAAIRAAQASEDVEELTPEAMAAEKPGRVSTAADVLQLAGDAVGVVDPTGVVDAGNAAVSLGRVFSDPGRREEHLKNAAISAAGIIPYLGDTAKLFKVGRAGKTVKRASQLSEIAEAGKRAKRIGYRGAAGQAFDLAGMFLGGGNTEKGGAAPAGAGGEGASAAGNGGPKIDGDQLKESGRLFWETDSINEFIESAKGGRIVSGDDPGDLSLEKLLGQGASPADAARTFLERHGGFTQSGHMDVLKAAGAMEAVQSQARSLDFSKLGRGGGAPPNQPPGTAAPAGGGDDPGRDPREIEEEKEAREELKEETENLKDRFVDLALGVGKATAVVVGLYEGIRLANKANLAINSHLQNFNAEIAQAMAQREIAEVQRSVRVGEDMSGPMSRAADADIRMEDFREEFTTPIKGITTDLQALLTSTAVSIGEIANEITGASKILEGIQSGVSRMARGIEVNKSYFDMTDAEKEEVDKQMREMLWGGGDGKGNGPSVPAWQGFLDDISDGKFDDKADDGNFFSRRPKE